MRKVVAGFLWLVALAIVGTVLYTRVVDRYQRDGTVQVDVLAAPVRVVRDGPGHSLHPRRVPRRCAARPGLGHGQDRGFQLEVQRDLSSGRLAELVGESALETDIDRRLAGTAGRPPPGGMLAPLTGASTNSTWRGSNAYIANQGDERQFGFGSSASTRALDTRRT